MSAAQQNHAIAQLGDITVTDSQLDHSNTRRAGIFEPFVRGLEIITSMFHAPGTKEKPGLALSGLMGALGVTAGLFAGNIARDKMQDKFPNNPYSDSPMQRLAAVFYRAVPPLFGIVGGYFLSNNFYRDRENITLQDPKNVLGLVEKAQNLHGQSVTKAVAFGNTLGASSGIRPLGFTGLFNSLMFSLRQYVTVATPGLNKLLSGVNDNEGTGPVTIFKRMTDYCSNAEDPKFEKIRYYADAVLTRISNDSVPPDILNDRARKMALELYTVVQAFKNPDGSLQRKELKDALKELYGSDDKINALIFTPAKDGKIESAVKPGDKDYAKQHRAIWGGLGMDETQIRTTPGGWLGKCGEALVTEASVKDGLSKVQAKVGGVAVNVRKLSGEASTATQQLSR